MTAPPAPEWERAVVLGALPVRMLADLVGDAPIPGLGVSVTVPLMGAMVVALLVVVARHAADLPRHPLRWPLAALGALLVVGLVRAPDAIDGVWAGVRIGSAFLFLLATGVVRVGPRALLGPALGAGAVSVAVSLGALATGQMDVVVHDGIHRLLGAYGDVHTHGLVMALVAGGALALAVASDRPRVRGGAAALAAAATLCMALSWVRTAAVLLALVAVGTLGATRRWRLLAVVAVGSFVVVAVLPTARERAADLISLGTLSEPAEGWASIGRFRPAIWANATTAFLDLPPTTWLFGNGLGGHLTFWKPRDPHDEYLALWFQMGLAAPFAWLIALGIGVREAWARRREAAALGDRVLYGYIASLAVGAALVAVISNTFVARVTLGWWLWGFLGVAMRPAPRDRAAG